MAELNTAAVLNTTNQLVHQLMSSSLDTHLLLIVTLGLPSDKSPSPVENSPTQHSASQRLGSILMLILFFSGKTLRNCQGYLHAYTSVMLRCELTSMYRLPCIPEVVMTLRRCCTCLSAGSDISPQSPAPSSVNFLPKQPPSTASTYPPTHREKPQLCTTSKHRKSIPLPG